MDELTPSGESAVRLALMVARVDRLHRRRKHTSNGGERSDGGWDFVGHGQTEFPDLCDHCETPWPCPTARALESE